MNKEPVEAPYAVSVGTSMLVFVICEATLILFMDIHSAISHRYGKRMRVKVKNIKGKMRKKQMKKTCERPSQSTGALIRAEQGM